MLKAQVTRFVEHEEHVHHEAMKKAGLDLDIASSPEIRAALRGMSQKERDQAVKDAFVRKDRLVLNALTHTASPLLSGHLTVPFPEMLHTYVRDENPGMAEELDDARFAQESLEYGWETFTKTVAEMRDRGAETRDAEGEARAKEAEAALAAAMQGAA